MVYNTGDRVGPYEILAMLGEGGMGEVYKARDTRLDRPVAIKAAKTDFTERFEREARAVAALNHPNICQIYDVGPNYLVMEFVEGTELSGPLPVATAAAYASQILDALDAAHRKRITHRDLKPANILLTKQGIKLLDFGLAKFGAPLADADATVVAGISSKGQIAGTLQYMAPEQLQGKEADARSDLFAFGCVLYEMLSGRRAFAGESAASVIAAILEREPEALQLAPPLDRVIRRCLAKDPDQRFQNALDLKSALQWALDGPGSDVAPASSNKLLKYGWIAAAILLLMLATSVVLRVPERPIAAHLFIPLPAQPGFGQISISPDGNYIVFGAGNRLWLRPLRQTEAKTVPDSEGAWQSFWAPDSRSFAFASGGKLKRTDINRSPPTVICDTEDLRGGAWNEAGAIVFAPDFGQRGLFRVAATGGKTEQVTKLDSGAGENSHRFPVFLPGGTRFLYTARAEKTEQTKIYVGDLSGASRTEILTGATVATFAEPGYLLFTRSGSLLAQPFSPSSLQLSGEATPLASNVTMRPPDLRPRYSASGNGVLTFTSDTPQRIERLAWFDRKGKAIEFGPRGRFGNPSVSPDGITIAYDRPNAATRLDEIWLYDTRSGTESLFLSGAHPAYDAKWSSDGAAIYFTSLRPSIGHFFQAPVRGPGKERVVAFVSGSGPRLTDLSSNGKFLIFSRAVGETGRDVHVLPLDDNAKPAPLIETEANEREARLSPSGSLIAYVSDETKRQEVYLQAFPTPGSKRRVSVNGGVRPVWSRDGRELYFLSPDRKLMAAAMQNGLPSVPQPLFEVQRDDVEFDVSNDGRFLIPVTVEEPPPSPISVILNWHFNLGK